RGVAKRFLYRPAPGVPLVVPGSVEYLVFSHAEITARIKAHDPYLYSDAAVETEFTAGETKTLANAGTVTATGVSSSSLGAMSWSITSGGCTAPYVAHSSGERWT